MKRYVRAARFDFYFGKSERDLFGKLISEAFPGWIISKRIVDTEEEFSLASVADKLKEMYPQQCGDTYTITLGNESQTEEFDEYAILGALEGMCHNGEACEVADGFYYVGSYADWHNDKDAQNELNDILSGENS